MLGGAAIQGHPTDPVLSLHGLVYMWASQSTCAHTQEQVKLATQSRKYHIWNTPHANTWQIQIKVKLATPSRKYHIWNTAHTYTHQIKIQLQYKSNCPPRVANTTSGTLYLRIHTETNHSLYKHVFQAYLAV